MVTFDTNVVVRLIVDDDEAQCRLAEAAWRSALATSNVFLPKLVLVETAWVLRTAYRFDRGTIAQTLRDLVDVDGVEVEDEQRVRRSLERFGSGGVGFSDHLIIQAARQADALPIKTFDRRLAAEQGVELVGEAG